MAELLFARFTPKTLEPKDSIGAKWPRLLDRLDLARAVSGKRTAIKMHLGGGTGFSTIHPYFVRKLVEKVKAAGAKEVFVTDTPGSVLHAAERGYTAETLGCPLVSATGTADRYFYKQAVEPAFLSLNEVELAGEIVDAEAMIDFSHVKGHGDCGFGGAAKNLSMGCVTGRTRGKLHGLEGGLEWDERKCKGCNICMENCPNRAIRFEHSKFSVFYHHCKLCQHCVLICPKKALKMVGGRYKDFQQGLAIATSKVLNTFAPENVVFINMLMNITIFCDCWGMTQHALVPDIGILAGRDIVAIETATLDMIRARDLIPGTLPAKLKLGKKGHLFERIHGKDPYPVVGYLDKLGHGTKKFKLTEVE
jgi:uncharacterized Fe-S center protein